ncbi:hypothetical protein GGH99_000037 [Coemansia sp. RSA 1285]|nr:hypothetical protein GGH99_000037 [Coemansia sp. RSA 1285]
MSSRAVKKLLKESGYDDLAETAAMVEKKAGAAKNDENSEEEEKETESKQQQQQKKQNMFDLLMGDDGGHEESSSEEEESAASNETPRTPEAESKKETAGGRGRGAARGAGKRKGGKKAAAAAAAAPGGGKGKSGQQRGRNKGKRVAADVDELEMSELQKHLDELRATEEEEEDTEASGRGSKMSADDETASSAEQHKRTRELLAADVKNLDAEAEIRRMFGSAAAAAANDSNARIGRRRVPRHLMPKRLTLTRPKLTWPPLQHVPGVSVEAIDEAKTDAATRRMMQADEKGGRWFAVEHSERFRAVQVEFLEAVVRNDADAIAAIVYHHPYHVDALLQLSEIIKQTGGEFGEAAALVERALYAFEQGFAPQFNIAAGTARLDFRRIESRGLFLAVFRHMQFLARRGCWRTAFEVNKLLLSLAPKRDPYGALLTLDFHAMKAAQYEYVVRFADQWEWAPVSMMPGWGFSRALAAFMLEKQQKQQQQPRQVPQRQSTDLLVDAILTFPTAVPVLWAKANIDLDTRIVGHPYFEEPTAALAGAGDSAMTHMQLLVQLFVERGAALYRVPEVIRWLQEGLRLALARIDAIDTAGGDTAFVERKQRVQSAMCSYVVPESVSRHVLVADMEALKAGLPDRIRSATESYAFDPLPPPDNIDPYSGFVGGMMMQQNVAMPGAFFANADAGAEGEVDADLLQRLLGFVRRHLGDAELGDPGTSDDDDGGEEEGYEEEDHEDH